jgi:hypothetical protein
MPQGIDELGDGLGMEEKILQFWNRCNQQFRFLILQSTYL